MSGPVRKEKQFGLAYDFCKKDVTILSRKSHSASWFSAWGMIQPMNLSCKDFFINFNLGIFIGSYRKQM